MLVMVQYNGG